MDDLRINDATWTPSVCKDIETIMDNIDDNKYDAAELIRLMASCLEGIGRQCFKRNGGRVDARVVEGWVSDDNCHIVITGTPEMDGLADGDQNLKVFSFSC